MNELLAPRVARLLGAREIGRGKSTPPPKPRYRSRAELVQAEPGERHGLDPAGKRLRRLPPEIGSDAAENQEARRERAPIDEDAENREELRPALNHENLTST